MATFQEAPFLPDPSQLRLDHITAMLALLLGEPLRTSPLQMLYPSYTPADLTYIWSVWDPHIRPPSPHPLAEGTLAKNIVLAFLRMDYILGGRRWGHSCPNRSSSGLHPRRDVHSLHGCDTLGGGNGGTHPVLPPPPN